MRYEAHHVQPTPPPLQASAPPAYPLNPTHVPQAGSTLYPALSDFMGLDLSPQALAELAPKYAVAVPQPVSNPCVYGNHNTQSWKLGIISWDRGIFLF